MTNKELIREAMKLLGESKSPAKKRAARDNGKLGGRPKSKKKRKQGKGTTVPRSNEVR